LSWVGYGQRGGGGAPSISGDFEGYRRAPFLSGLSWEGVITPREPRGRRIPPKMEFRSPAITVACVLPHPTPPPPPPPAATNPYLPRQTMRTSFRHTPHPPPPPTLDQKIPSVFCHAANRLTGLRLSGAPAASARHRTAAQTAFISHEAADTNEQKIVVIKAVLAWLRLPRYWICAVEKKLVPSTIRILMLCAPLSSWVLTRPPHLHVTEI